MAIQGAHSPFGGAFTLLWDPVTRRADGSALPDPARYNVYRRETLDGPSAKVNSDPLTISVFADIPGPRTCYYVVRTVDGDGQESADSLVLDSSPDTNLVVLAEDGVSKLTIPGEVAFVLSSNGNKHGVPLTIAIKEDPVSAQEDVIRSLDFQFLRGDMRTLVRDVAFARPLVKIDVGFREVNGRVARDAFLTDATPDQLALYWENGVAWVKVGGSRERGAGAVTILSSNFGRYQLRVAAKANALTLSKANVFPGLFTPNNDGRNDRVYFILENPNNAGVTGHIFDRRGRQIATMSTASQAFGVGTALVWSGHDEEGSVVPSGLYLYQIKGDGDSITGTVAVAR